MRIYTKAVYVWDETIGAYHLMPEESESYIYEGPVALCKGDSTDQSTEQLQNQNLQQQMQYNTQLMNIFQTQFSNQQNVLQYIQGKMQPMIDNPTGYTQ